MEERLDLTMAIVFQNHEIPNTLKFELVFCSWVAWLHFNAATLDNTVTMKAEGQHWGQKEQRRSYKVATRGCGPSTQ